jgi:citrate synthase
MHDMLEIGSAGKAAEWQQGKFDRKDKIIGFGHRVYKNGDSRVPTMKEALNRVAAARDGQKWLDIYEVLEKGMAAANGIKPNLDFPTGPAYS